MIQITDFHKAYGRLVAVSRLNLRLEPGQVLGLIGPNGAGKTTTLRTLAGISPPTRGELIVAGYNVVTESVAAKRRLAYIADDPQLFSDLTVQEHLQFYAAAYGVTQAQDRAAELLIDFQLEQKRDELARNLSRGMRQKLAICCAYIYDPPVLLFDEPMTGLDPLGIRQFKESVRQRAASGATIMVSSHLLAIVEDICSHVMIFQAGQVQAFGTLAEIKQQAGEAEQVRSLEEIFFLTTGQGTPLSELVNV